MEFLHMAKELNDLSDQFCHNSSQQGRVPKICEQKDQAMKEAWEGRGGAQLSEDVI